jgi:hypothetical protein
MIGEEKGGDRSYRGAEISSRPADWGVTAFGRWPEYATEFPDEVGSV